MVDLAVSCDRVFSATDLRDQPVIGCLDNKLIAHHAIPDQSGPHPAFRGPVDLNHTQASCGYQGPGFVQIVEHPSVAAPTELGLHSPRVN